MSAIIYDTWGGPFAQESSLIAPRNDTRGEQHRINDRIRSREVRLIGPTGDQLGIKPVPDALRMARGFDLDLVEVAPGANPPVCRIMDYGKFKYEEGQKAKEARKKSTNVTVKEVKYRPKIGKGDFDTKTRNVIRFIEEGHKVKITLQFRGREMAHPELGSKILDQVLESVGAAAKVDTQARFEGRSMTMVLSPDKQAQEVMKKAAAEAGKEAAAAAAAEVGVTPAEAPEVEAVETSLEAPEVAAVEMSAEAPEVAAVETSTDAPDADADDESAEAPDTATAESGDTEDPQ
ncbi:translation initiation factor IF-3 [Ilumatobacter sp.]|uniref:translation initiation factor IF-3 n=1 Tax=Ilumatobacter sp. TaxID=1967498 RepID=UPI003753E71E